MKGTKMIVISMLFIMIFFTGCNLFLEVIEAITNIEDENIIKPYDSEIQSEVIVSDLNPPKSIMTEGFTDCIYLWWTKVNNADYYIIYRSLNAVDDDFKLLITTRDNDYYDMVNTDDQEYYYKIAVVADDGRVSDFTKAIKVVLINNLSIELVDYSIRPYSSNWSRISGIIRNNSNISVETPKIIVKTFDRKNKIIEIRSSALIPNQFFKNQEFPFIMEFYSKPEAINSIQVKLGYLIESDKQSFYDKKFSYEVTSIENAQFPYEIGVNVKLRITNIFEESIKRIFAYCTNQKGDILNIGVGEFQNSGVFSTDQSQEISIIFPGEDIITEIDKNIVYSVQN